MAVRIYDIVMSIDPVMQPIFLYYGAFGNKDWFGKLIMTKVTF